MIASPWQWQPHPEVWVPLGLLLGGYFLAVTRWGAAKGRRFVATRKQKLCFTAGVLVLWLSVDWPMDELADHYLFSAHMVQHMIIGLVAPPLLLLGMPAWLLRRLLAPRPVFKLVRAATKPVVGFLAFNGMFVFLHWPALMNETLRSEPVHFLVHLGVLITALMMWWPVVDPLPELSRLSYPAKMLYLFLQSVLPTVPASFLTFAHRPIYTFYESVPRLWGMSVVVDQMVAGLIMKIVGGLLLWGVIAVMFFRWYAREEAGNVTEQVSWEDFERELQAWDMRT
ncbi:MAG TPA: cytochrome c oxidase assembly protein [Actinomycetota bacterium]|jgi:putative membrane protein|nr:cytochrome c oxidase assembly protein [Actinomycetota bacterium]